MKAESPESSGSVITPTQTLRDRLSAFRFNAESTPSLRQSPRNHVRTVVKAEEEDSELPVVLITSVPRKRSASIATAGSDAKKARSRSRPSGKASKAKPAVASPEQYAHLNALNDYLGQEPDMLDVLFCGINPGQKSATVGHHFAHPTNHFWKCLHGAQLTDRLLPASEDYTLPDSYYLGLTNLVERPSAQAAELANSEFTAGVPALLHKIVRKRPRVVCFVGKAIWESFIKAAAPSILANEELVSADVDPYEVSVKTEVVTAQDHMKGTSVALMQTEKKAVRRSTSKRKATVKTRTFEFGLQPYKIVHSDTDARVKETLFCAVVSTSGLVAGYQLPEKIQQFSLIKQCLEKLKSGDLDTSAMSVIPVSESRRA
ncbi:hypothetical protein BN946_scf185002.g12 [Trametes cinnabarina]|uniref:Uracil-DNA glycosylase-like domain-containing protein n=1 Tax=Pycnoporus cinnabarinus TaxID=5643 RepID=A0A060SED8_PYCCI|nr:hypothetical protein BN946_scf185002.g12 [Trametes cinnabarina]